jgi:hypothetical protein
VVEKDDIAEIAFGRSTPLIEQGTHAVFQGHPQTPAAQGQASRHNKSGRSNSQDSP